MDLTPGSKFERLLDWTDVQHAPDTVIMAGRFIGERQLIARRDVTARLSDRPVGATP